MLSFLLNKKTTKTKNNADDFYSISMDKLKLNAMFNEEKFNRRTFNSKKNVKNCNIII